MAFRGRHMGANSDHEYVNDSMVVPTYMDAVVPGINKYNNCLYFFKVFSLQSQQFIAKYPIF